MSNATDQPKPTRRSDWKRRVRVLLLLGIAAIGGAMGYLVFFQWRPIGAGPAGPNVPRELFQSPWTDRQVLLVGIGDSVTAGLGAKSADHSYFNRLVNNPSDEFDEMRGLCLAQVIPNLKTENLAVSGSTSLAHWNTVQNRLAAQTPDTLGIIVMTTGGNDIIHDYGRSSPREGAMYGATLAQARPWIDNYRRRLNQMLDAIGERFPGGCHVFLADIYDPTDGIGDAPSVFLPDWPDGLAIHTEYNRVIHECADERANVHLVPLHATFLGHGSHCRQFWRATYQSADPTYWYYDNIEDPNDRGYDAIRRIYLIEIARVLTGGKRESSTEN